MRKFLLIGDPHVTIAELRDSQNLIDFIVNIVKETHATPIFMGDLYDSHAIIRAEVLRFWYDALERLNKIQKPILLTGNHDISTNKNSQVSALLAHVDQAYVATEDYPVFSGDVGCFAYYHDHEKMVKVAKSRPFKFLLCHQTFQGAQYENGFYAKDGIDQSLFPQTRIISGHIHKSAQLGKVLYIGAPRWRTVSDADETERYLYLVDSELNFLNKYPTSPVCSRIHRLLDTQELPLPSIDLNIKDRYFIDIHGDKQFILSRKTLYPQAKVRTFEKKLQHKTILSNKDPIATSLNRWVGKFEPKHTQTDEFQNRFKQDPFFAKKL